MQGGIKNVRGFIIKLATALRHMWGLSSLTRD